MDGNVVRWCRNYQFMRAACAVVPTLARGRASFLMEKEHKTCCITGHRPKGFPWNYDDKSLPQQQKYLADLHAYVQKLINDGYDRFISGGALGADTDFADIVLELKKSHPSIELEIAVPCPQQATKWNSAQKKHYHSILDQADTVTIVSPHYTPYCMQMRNEYMVDKSQFVLAVFNPDVEKSGTDNTVRYARRKERPIEFIPLGE